MTAPIPDPRVTRLHHALDEVLELVAARVEHTIRTARAEHENREVRQVRASGRTSAVVLGGRDGPEPDIDASLVIAAAAEFFGVTVGELCGPGRTRHLARARQIAMYLCRELAGLSLPRIGRSVGGRDHTTVMHAHRKIRREVADRGHTHDQVTGLTVLVTRRAAMTARQAFDRP